MNRIVLFVIMFVIFSVPSFKAQNLLDTSTWSLGGGTVSGFSNNGQVSENIRWYDIDPFGNSSVVWIGGNDAESNADGGWDSDYFNIDNSETYRFVVWLKKTNSNNGNSYFGCQQWQSSTDTNLYDYTILKLNDDIRPNPYFWVGDLPQLNKWYLLVGYVHGKNYDSNLSYGGIYDPLTGNKVQSIEDFKFSPTTSKLRHRAYLYYDTNTSDRQHFFAPRMEMVDGNEPSIADLLGLNDVDNNLLDDSTWTIGCGSVSGFSQNGSTSENCRELGRNHVGEEVVLWKGGNDSANNADGGWNTNWISNGINHNTTYRFSVWLKKTNSNNGHSYLGFNANNSGSLRLNGSYNSNPYFWVGDLPKLNRWYLVVGYVHKSSYSSTTNLGRIYDGVTGEEVSTITDYKLKNTVTALRHRSYLYYDTDTSDRQYFWAPRIDPITGNEPTVTELLRINENSKLIFSYDIAGNQKQRFYCEEDGFCSPVAPQSRIINEEGVKILKKGVFVAEQTDIPLPGEESKENSNLLDLKYSIYPNPTSGRVTIQLSGRDYNLTNSINIYSVNGSLVKRIDINNPKNQIELDVSNMSSGTYFIHMHFTNGTVKTERIIKK